MKSKYCSKCKKTKSINEFGKNIHEKDGKNCYCKPCAVKVRLKWKRKNRRKDRMFSRRRIRKLRKQVIEAYGGICECCGEVQLRFLTIDHRYGGGRKHRDSVGGNGKFYNYLRNNKFPKDLGLRVLCMNCNMATMHGRICPHQFKGGYVNAASSTCREDSRII